MAEDRNAEQVLNAETLSPVLPDRVIQNAISLLEEANEAGIGIATAESCTGGLLASLLTDRLKLARTS